ncbi:hypothetical protein GF348_24520 [candidate division KSB3 bacterium]|nr:hypothetical protein [candidate division KSB3 bacterium]
MMQKQIEVLLVRANLRVSPLLRVCPSYILRSMAIEVTAILSPLLNGGRESASDGEIAVAVREALDNLAVMEIHGEGTCIQDNVIEAEVLLLKTLGVLHGKV